MTSIPASRRALATTFAPRSWPSSPAFAMTTRMLPIAPSRPAAARPAVKPSSTGSVTAEPFHPGRDCPAYPGRGRADEGFTLRVLQLLQGGIAQHQVLDAVPPAKVDLRLGAVVDAFHRHDRAQPELVVRHPVPGRKRRHRPVAGRADPGPLRHALRDRRRGGGLIPP